jgi:WD40 repeat protein
MPDPSQVFKSGKVSIRKVVFAEAAAVKEFPRLALSGDGRRALSAEKGGPVRLWSVDGSLKEIGKLPVPLNKDALPPLALSGDGTRALVGWPGTVQAWDVMNGTRLSQLENYKGAGYALALSPDGKRALAADNNDVVVWDAETGKHLGRLKGHTGGVGAVSFQPDGAFALTASGDGALRLWEVDTGKEVRRFPAGAPVGRRAVTADGKRLAAWSNAIHVWDVETGAELWKKNIPSPWAEVALLKEGRLLAAVSSDQGKGVVRILDGQTGEQLGQFEGPDWTIGRLLFTPDGEHLFGVGKGALVLWEVRLDE